MGNSLKCRHGNPRNKVARFPFDFTVARSHIVPMWTRKRTVIAGDVLEDDWIIMRNGEDVGRISLDEFPYNGAQHWQWASWVHPATHGRVDTLEEAQDAVRRAVLGAG